MQYKFLFYFEGKSLIKFSSNKASECGAVCILNQFNVTFELSEMAFSRDIFMHFTGTELKSSIIFKDACIVVFSDNKAEEKGGAISCYILSCLAITDNSSVTFDNNRARIGGATYFSNQSILTIDDYSLIIFSNNAATSGGSLFTENYVVITIKGYSVV